MVIIYKYIYIHIYKFYNYILWYIIYTSFVPRWVGYFKSWKYLPWAVYNKLRSLVLSTFKYAWARYTIPCRWCHSRFMCTCQILFQRNDTCIKYIDLSHTKKFPILQANKEEWYHKLILPLSHKEPLHCSILEKFI